MRETQPDIRVIATAIIILRLILLLSQDGQLANGAGLRKKLMVEPENSGRFCDDNSHWKNVAQPIAYFVNSLPPTNLHIAFQDGPDECLVNIIWNNGIAAKIMTGKNVLETIRESSYDLTQQYLVVGDLNWITYVLSVAKEQYAADKMNAMKTRWLWVLSESFNRPFHEILNDVTLVLIEGIRGLFIQLSQQKDDTSSKWSMNIGSVDDTGDGFWILHRAATWTSENGLIIKRPLWPALPYDFKGRTIRIVHIKKPTVFDLEDGQILPETVGYTADIMKEIQKRLKFSHVLIPTKGFGSLLSNGSWNGMVGVLSRGEADIAPLDFSPNHQRTLVIDFGLFYGIEYVLIVSKAPSIFVKPFILLQIFTPLVWGCFLFIGLTSGVIIWGLLKLRAKLMQENEDEGNMLRYSTASLMILTYQSNSCWFGNSSNRLVGGSMMLLAIIFASLYSGSITAFLAIPFRSVYWQ